MAVVNALKDLGADNASANRSSGEVAVEYDPDVVSLNDIKKEIAEVGYEVI